MDKIIIRTVDKNDLTACHTIEARSFPPGEAALTSSIAARINHYPEGFLVAEYGGQLIGQLNSGATYKDDISDEAFKQLIGHDPEGHNLVIFSLSVLPEYRNMGVASGLLQQFVDQAKELGKTNILLLCKDNLISFYAARGFQDQGVSDSDHGGATWHTMLLQLQEH